MVDLIESIVCSACTSTNACNVKDKIECGGNIDGEIYVSDICKGIRTWLSSFDTNSATECFTAVNLLKERLENEQRTKD